MVRKATPLSKKPGGKAKEKLSKKSSPNEVETTRKGAGAKAKEVVTVEVEYVGKPSSICSHTDETCLVGQKLVSGSWLMQLETMKTSRQAFFPSLVATKACQKVVAKQRSNISGHLHIMSSRVMKSSRTSSRKQKMNQ